MVVPVASLSTRVIGNLSMILYNLGVYVCVCFLFVDVSFLVCQLFVNCLFVCLFVCSLAFRIASITRGFDYVLVLFGNCHFVCCIMFLFLAMINACVSAFRRIQCSVDCAYVTHQG